MKALGLQDIDVSAIELGPRLRPVSMPHASMIAANIGETGHLKNPVEIRKVAGGKYRVVTGAHRFIAIRDVLKWPKIRASVLEANDDEAKLAEIDENLYRRDLDAWGQAKFLAERKRLYERLHPQTKRGAQGGRGGKRNETDILSFSKDVAEKVGFTDRTIRRQIAIANGISPGVASKIPGTFLARRQADLLAISKLPADQQMRVVDGLLADTPKWSSLRAAIESVTGQKKKRELSVEDKAWAVIMRLTPAKQRHIYERLGKFLTPKRMEAAE